MGYHEVSAVAMKGHRLICGGYKVAVSSDQIPQKLGDQYFDRKEIPHHRKVMRAVSLSCFLCLSLGATAGTDPAAEVNKKWEGLIKHNPFGGPPPIEVEKKPEPPPALELRGVVTEGGVRWFTFFDSSNKQWTTVREGGRDEGFAIRAYDKEHEAVTLDWHGKMTLVALKTASIHSYSPALPTPTNLAVAPNPAQPGAIPPAVIAAMPAGELQRIQKVTDGIEQRRAARGNL